VYNPAIRNAQQISHIGIKYHYHAQDAHQPYHTITAHQKYVNHALVTQPTMHLEINVLSNAQLANK
jgi:hypothetical protein